MEAVVSTYTSTTSTTTAAVDAVAHHHLANNTVGETVVSSAPRTADTVKTRTRATVAAAATVVAVVPVDGGAEDCVGGVRSPSIDTPSTHRTRSGGRAGGARVQTLPLP